MQCCTPKPVVVTVIPVHSTMGLLVYFRWYIINAGNELQCDWWLLTMGDGLVGEMGGALELVCQCWLDCGGWKAEGEVVWERGEVSVNPTPGPTVFTCWKGPVFYK